MSYNEKDFERDLELVGKKTQPGVYDPEIDAAFTRVVTHAVRSVFGATRDLRRIADALEELNDKSLLKS